MQVTFNPSITNRRSSRQCKKQNPAFEGYYLEKPVALTKDNVALFQNRLIDSDVLGKLKTTTEELLQAYKDTAPQFRNLYESLFIRRGLKFPPNIN